MGGFATQFLLNAVCLAVLMGAAWGLSLRRNDVSHVDACWGLGFVAVAWISYLVGSGYGPRMLLLLCLVTIWGMRLAIHLGCRALAADEEDARYAAMRANRGSAFRWQSLYVIFGLQGLLILILSLPVQAAMSSGDGPLGLLDYLGLALFLAGFAIETLADAQLDAFKAARKAGEEPRAVLDSGLWALSRHPNYFGETVLWWGIFLIAASAGAFWTVFAPVLTTYLILKVSGVALLDRHMASRPGYADYAARTPAFLPRWPRL